VSLRGANILITGGRRIGSALARELIDRGANLALTYKSSREKAEGVVAAAVAAGGAGVAIEADLSDGARAIRVVDEVVARLGRVDALVNMASTYTETPFRGLTPADFDRMIADNLAAPYHVAVAAGKAMLDQEPGPDGLRGRIINIGDWATDRPGRGYLPYLAAKGALTTLTMALAAELAPSVLVNLIQPGTVEPPPDVPPERLDLIRDQTPTRRIGTPGDIVRMILFLLEGTDFATGAAFRVDGGRFLGRVDGGMDK
jgi:pteridine reductase